MMLLKSKIATKIIKMNYVQSFCLQEDKIIKEGSITLEMG